MLTRGEARNESGVYTEVALWCPHCEFTTPTASEFVEHLANGHGVPLGLVIDVLREAEETVIARINARFSDEAVEEFIRRVA